MAIAVGRDVGKYESSIVAVAMSGKRSLHRGGLRESQDGEYFSLGATENQRWKKTKLMPRTDVCGSRSMRAAA